MQVTRQSRRKTMRAQATPQQRKNVQPMNRMQATPQQRKNVQPMNRMQASPIVKKKVLSQSLGRQMLNIKK